MSLSKLLLPTAFMLSIIVMTHACACPAPPNPIISIDNYAYLAQNNTYYVPLGSTIEFDGSYSNDADDTHTGGDGDMPGGITAWTWSFGDGSGFSENISDTDPIWCEFCSANDNYRDGIHKHKYDAPGRYTVRLTVTDDDSTETNYSNQTAYTEVIIIVFQVDMDVEYLPDDDEYIPGGYITSNTDDDNNNGIPDYFLTEYPIPDEDNLIKVTFSIDPPDIEHGLFRFCLADGWWYSWYPRAWSGKGKNSPLIPSQVPPDTENGEHTYLDWPPNMQHRPWRPSLYVEATESCNIYMRAGFIPPNATYLQGEDRVTLKSMTAKFHRAPDWNSVLDDHSPDGVRPRSPRYIFGQNDPIYLEVYGLGLSESSTKEEFIWGKVESDYSETDICLKESNSTSGWFNNNWPDPSLGFYRNLITLVDSAPQPGETREVWIPDEDILQLKLRVPTRISPTLVTCADVMVDRLEIGVEGETSYHPYAENISTWQWYDQLYSNINTTPGAAWHTNFKNANADCKPEHWHKNSDAPYADSVDLVSWSGHSYYVPQPDPHGWPQSKTMTFMTDSGLYDLYRDDIRLGTDDTDWVIFDTCKYLVALGPDDMSVVDLLKRTLLPVDPSAKCARLYMGAGPGKFTYWDGQMQIHIYPGAPSMYGGQYFARRISEIGVKEAWFEYAQYFQRNGFRARVFGTTDTIADSLEGEGPIALTPDPVPEDAWLNEDYDVVK